MKYNEGDVVRIRQWKDMADEFGVDEYGCIKCLSAFTGNMKYLCGTEITLDHGVDRGTICYVDGYTISTDMVEHIKYEDFEASEDVSKFFKEMMVV